MGYREKYEIVKGKDKCYDSLRKSLAKLSSALNKAKYINKGAYATLYYNSDEIGSCTFSKNKRTYYDYDYEFRADKYDVRVNFEKCKMSLYTTLDITDEDRNNPEFMKDSEWIKVTLKAIKEGVKEMGKISPDYKKAHMDIVCNVIRKVQY